MENQLDDVRRTYDRMKKEFQLLVGHFIGERPLGKPPDTRLFSDTFFIWTDGATDAHFTKMLFTCGCLFLSAIEHGFMIRGAVTVGDLTVSGATILGKPIVEAAQYEKQQEWMGCRISDQIRAVVSRDALHELVSKHTLLEYEIPLKGDCPVGKALAFNWVFFVQFALMIEKKMTRLPTNDEVRRWTLFLDKHTDRWDHRRKLRNTIEFREYVLCNDLFGASVRTQPIGEEKTTITDTNQQTGKPFTR